MWAIFSWGIQSIEIDSRETNRSIYFIDINQKKLISWYQLESVNQSITTQKPFLDFAIDWHSNLEQTSRILPGRSSAIFRKP